MTSKKMKKVKSVIRIKKDDVVVFDNLLDTTTYLVGLAQDNDFTVDLRIYVGGRKAMAQDLSLRFLKSEDGINTLIKGFVIDVTPFDKDVVKAYIAQLREIGSVKS